MPRSAFRLPRIPRACGIAIGLIALGLVPPQTLRAAVAAAAGTLFESLPFVVAGVLLPRVFGRSGRAMPLAHTMLDLASCGCRMQGRRLRGLAFSVPAFALAWFTFGWWAAIGRVVFTLSLDAIIRMRAAARSRSLAHPRTVAGEHGQFALDPIETPRVEGIQRAIVGQIESVACAAAIGGFIAEFVRALITHQRFTVLLETMPSLAITSWLACFGIGAVIGASAPCATAGIALAGLLRGVDPALAFGALVSSGLAPIEIERNPNAIDARVEPSNAAGDRVALLALAFAGLVLAATREGGFVNTRLVIPIMLSAVACASIALAPIVRLRRGAGAAKTPKRLRLISLAAPATMLAALGLGSPPPSGAVISALDDAVPGDRMQTIGVLRAHGTLLVRATIVCCRADARLVGVRLARRDTHRDGTWLRTTGIVRERNGALELDASDARPIEPPSDPFAYL